jgi:hypothetical protein
MNRDKKIVQCYQAVKQLMMNTFEDLTRAINEGNPKDLPDPQFQLQILSSWMQMVQLIEDTYKLDSKPPTVTPIDKNQLN